MSERPADLLDQADQVIERLREAGIANVRHAARPQQVQNYDGSWPITECIVCGEDLPEARLERARVRCTLCEDTVERRRAQYYQQ